MLAILLSGSVALLGHQNDVSHLIYCEFTTIPEISAISVSEIKNTLYTDIPEEVIEKYLGQLRISPISGAPRNKEVLTFFFENSDIVLNLGEKYLTLINLNSVIPMNDKYFLLESEVDTDYILSLVVSKIESSENFE